MFRAPRGTPGARLASLTGIFNDRAVPLALDTRGGSWIEICPEGVGVRFQRVAGSTATSRCELAYYGAPYWGNVGEYWRGGIIRIYRDNAPSNWRARGQQHEDNDSPQQAITDQGQRHLWAELRGGASPFIGTSAPAGSSYTSTRASVPNPPPIPYGEPMAVRIRAKTNPAGGDSAFDLWIAPATWETATRTAPWKLSATMRGARFAYSSGVDGSFWKALGGQYGYPVAGGFSDNRIEATGYRTAAELDLALGWDQDAPPPPPPPPSDPCAGVRAQLDESVAQALGLVSRAEVAEARLASVRAGVAAETQRHAAAVAAALEAR